MGYVIPLANVKQMPTEPPVNLPKMPDMKELGTRSHLSEDQWKHSEEKLRLFKGDIFEYLATLLLTRSRDKPPIYKQPRLEQ